MRGADALIEAVAGQGIDTIFGVPGGAVLPLYDALATSPIRHILTRTRPPPDTPQRDGHGSQESRAWPSPHPGREQSTC